jgi:hypothetical protein
MALSPMPARPFSLWAFTNAFVPGYGFGLYIKRWPQHVFAVAQQADDQWHCLQDHTLVG